MTPQRLLQEAAHTYYALGRAHSDPKTAIRYQEIAAMLSAVIRKLRGIE